MSKITKRRPINWKSAQYSHKGLVRKINEDAMLCLPEQKLWAVADGMGGYEAGNIASDMIISSLKKLKFGGSLNETVNRVEDNLIEVNNLILAYGDILLDGRILGSTVVTLIIKGRVGICMWAGDSRLYRYRNRQLEQLTRDHSYVANQVMRGQITAKEAGDHPDSNKITRAVGADSEIYIDINAFSVQLDDIFLLCSDGLYNKVSNNEIAKTLASLSINQAVNELVLKALNNGADDNVSVVLILGEPDKSAGR